MPDITAVRTALADQRVETPSWGYGNSGTRFKVFAQPGVPRTPRELDDAAKVHEFTGVTPGGVAHPLGRGGRLHGAGRARDGPRPGTGRHQRQRLPRTDDLQNSAVLPSGRRGAAQGIAHLTECVDIMDATGSRDLKLWFADGTNYPGQDDITARRDRLAEASTPSTSAWARTSGYAPGVQSSSSPRSNDRHVPDWGTALRALPEARREGTGRRVSGHHAPGTNIEFIVAVQCSARESSAASTSTPASTPTTT